MNRTQVAIVGAGPAGLMLAHLLHQQGIDSVVLERQTRQHIEERVRAGVLEQGTVDLLASVSGRVLREGLVHHGVALRFGGYGHRIDFAALTGRAITIYAQHEVVKDLVAARLATGRELVFEAADVHLTGLAAEPRVHYNVHGESRELACDFIAGCDGFHGVSRASIPPDAITCYEHTYPFAWLGILARVAPASEELIYAYHERGFALLSMRSPEISRLYLQCAPDEDLAAWPESRIWDELRVRLALPLADGPVLQKGVTAMRGFVAEPMRYQRLFLAGDAAHIVPPTGAKGLNLAVADVRVLAEGLARYYASGDAALLDRYSEICLRRVWAVQRFSSWMTALLHRDPADSEFRHKLRLAELAAVVSSRAASTWLAENYVGLPFDPL